MTYSKVQFISYQLNTFPEDKGTTVTYDGNPFVIPLVTRKQAYTGDANEATDAAKRIELMKAAITKAAGSSKIKGDETLKIFVAPEFYFRGKKGAYEFPAYDTVVSELKTFASDSKFGHWLFLFGSALVVFAGDATDSTVEGDDNIICNTVLIQKGGTSNMRCVVKEHKSGIDFLAADGRSLRKTGDGRAYMLDHETVGGGYIDPDVTHMKAGKNSDGGEQQAVDYDGKGVFTEGGIKFGVEVCLDHLAQRLLMNKASVQIQLVPSAGMDLKTESLVATKYALNVDGGGINAHTTAKAVTSVASINGSGVVTNGTLGSNVTVLEELAAHKGGSTETTFKQLFDGNDGIIKVHDEVSVI